MKICVSRPLVFTDFAVAADGFCRLPLRSLVQLLREWGLLPARGESPNGSDPGRFGQPIPHHRFWWCP
jgi:hypothetical protein